jgi:hypothetical protein
VQQSTVNVQDPKPPILTLEPNTAMMGGDVGSGGAGSGLESLSLTELQQVVHEKIKIVDHLKRDLHLVILSGASTRARNISWSPQRR